MGKTTEKITDAMKTQLITLYNEGKMDSEIAKTLGVTRSAIMYWRKKLKLKSKFTYQKIAKADYSEIKRLFDKGLSDYAIAKQLNMSPDGIYSHRIRHNLLRENNLRVNKEVEFTDLQKQILVGTLLGDASLRKGTGCINAKFTCMHGYKQKEYCEYKNSFFTTVGSQCKYHKRSKPDPRNGIYYEDYTMMLPSNPALNEFYEAFYKEGKKRIPEELFKYFSEISLAFMFMDDGCKLEKSYVIATNCFLKEDILKFRKFLFDKFNLETTMNSRNMVYIRACSKKHFEELISPYICESMKYKLHVS